MKIGFIGAGNMGEAYISGLYNDYEVSFCEKIKDRVEYLKEKYNVPNYSNVKELIIKSDIVFIAIKPQDFENVLGEIDDIKDEKIFISLAAGKTIEDIYFLTGKKSKCVRVMPNTPALIQKGVSGVSFQQNKFSEEEKKYILDLIKKTGEVVEIEEKFMDIVTGISGSGPAYVFLLINSLAEGGVKMGLNKETSLKLAVETFIGAAQMIKETGKHPEVLKDMVTSPGGTTVAGLSILEESGVRSALIKTVENAVNRSKELGKKG